MSEARCPICEKPVAGELARPPFGSARCRLVDLGQWLGGGYRTAGDERVSDPGVDSDDESTSAP